MEKIRDKINSIYSTKNSFFNSSLFGGYSGNLLFKFIYCKNRSDEEEFVKFGYEIQSLYENYLHENHPTFASGLSGINWFFAYLSKNDLLEAEDLQTIYSKDKLLLDQAISMLNAGNYDFLHGSLGIVYYLIYKETNLNDQFFELYVDTLEKISANSISKKSIPNYDILNQQINNNQINFGLSHGIPSVLKFCLQCYKQNVAKKQAKLIALNIIDEILSHRNKDVSRNYFPSLIDISDFNLNTFTRLAWCYGDLSIAYILYQAGIILDEKLLLNYAVEIFLHSTNRRSFEETGVQDAGICHGTAGIAHIYNKIWLHTKQNEFKKSCDYWIQRTLDFSCFPDGIAGYKKYNNVTKKFENDSSFLEGTSGIGLVLLTYLTGDFSWDYCLMLND